MLGKLLKHEFIATRRTLPLMYVAAAASTALMLLNAMLKTDNNFIMGILVFTVIGIFVAVGVMTIVMVISRYAKGLHGSEGYLTHALPATESQQLWAKLISGMFWVIVDAVVLAGLGVIIFYAMAAMQGKTASITEAFQGFLSQVELTPAEFWFKSLPPVILNALINTAGLLVMLFFSITLANTQPFSKHPAVFSVVFVYAISLAMQIISIPLLGLLRNVAPFGPNDMWSELFQFSYASLALNTVVYVGLFIATVQLLKYKLALK